MSKLQPHEIRDLGGALSEEVKAAIVRKIALVSTPNDALSVAVFALNISASIAAGAFAAVNGIEESADIDPLDVAISLMEVLKQRKAMGRAGG